MRKVAVYLAAVVVLAGLAGWAQVQSADGQQSLQQKLDAQFALTKTTADKTDIVTAGAVLVLHKDGLLMYSVAEPVSPLNTYKKGKISQSFGSTLGRNLLINTMTSIQPSDIPQRKFQAGEKFWVTSYTIQADGVVFQFFSDPYEDTRYYGELKFPFPKGQPPPADEIFKTIAEVVTVQPADNAGSGPTAAPAPGPPAPQPAAEQSQMRPIPPPPPPSDAPPPAPKEISLGQTEEQVIGIFGQPQRVAKAAQKEIYFYPNMKVTFLNGKVSAVD